MTFGAIETTLSNTVFSVFTNAIAYVGEESAPVVFDAPTLETLSGQALARAYEITLPVGTFPDLARGDSLRLDDNSTMRWTNPRWWTGKVFEVAEVRPMDADIKVVALRINLP